MSEGERERGAEGNGKAVRGTMRGRGKREKGEVTGVGERKMEKDLVG